MDLRWISVDAHTGRLIAFLPTFEPEWPLTDTLCASEAAQGKLYLDGAPDSWPQTIRAGGAVLACYDPTDPLRTIQWAGLVLDDPKDTDDPDFVSVAMVTGAGYGDCRYTRDLEYDNVGQNDIAVDLVTRYMSNSGDLPGMPFVTRVVPAGDPGPRRTVIWQNTDNAKVLDRLDALAAVEDGIEFTVIWEWQHDWSGIFPVFVVGSRLGVDPLPGRVPQMVFRMPGNTIRAQIGSSWVNGDGANVVEAIGPGQGDDATPTSGLRKVKDFAGRPAFEYRCDPQEVASQDDLNAIAIATLGAMANGKAPVSLTAVLNKFTAPGTVWSLGDTVAYQIGGVDTLTGREIVPALPGGISGQERVWSKQISKSSDGAPTIAPVFKVPVLPADQTEMVS